MLDDRLAMPPCCVSRHFYRSPEVNHVNNMSLDPKHTSDPEHTSSMPSCQCKVTAKLAAKGIPEGALDASLVGRASSGGFKHQNALQP